MNRGNSRLFAVGALALAGTLAACEQEPVLGYCDAGDTCRYDLPERMLVRTYNGYFEERHPSQQPAIAQETATAVVEQVNQSPAETAASSSPPATTVRSSAAAIAPTAALITVSN